MSRRCALLLALCLSGIAQAQELLGPQGALPVYHEALRERLSFSHGWRDGADPVAWTRAGRAKARELMLPAGGDTTAIPFAPRLLAEQDRGRYIARRIALQINRDSRVQALLLVPKAAGPHPAALLLHDHGARFDIGKEKLVWTWDDPAREAASAAWAARYFSGRLPGEQLAARGYVVLAVDALGWGQRGAAGFGYESQQALAANLFNLGTSWAALIAGDDQRAAQFLAGLPEVDARRIAAVGFSMGAQRAWQLAALSEHIAATIAVNWMGTLEGLMRPGGNQLKGQSAFAMLHPGLARHFDYPDIAALAAPRAMLVYAGGRDPLFPPEAVEPALARLRAVWAAYGAGEQLQTRVWPEAAHEFNAAQQDAAFDWLDARFGVSPAR
ncbi:dienelactone hydrolase family protein [Roseateles violae]|uniref:Dienelactone hydrolase family protein n=1 Tax=Roseateles violae TaxID=3058042 RepID=A0ABT8DSJ4_9BURK|nr:dienelactone hydrolase family protein [Pelomonas sp. PFR6]MDN3921296.1 dienelactone hydrolase family protein [Pelomonas sp. PFR6]